MFFLLRRITNLALIALVLAVGVAGCITNPAPGTTSTQEYQLKAEVEVREALTPQDAFKRFADQVRQNPTTDKHQLTWGINPNNRSRLLFDRKASTVTYRQENGAVKNYTDITPDKIGTLTP